MTLPGPTEAFTVTAKTKIVVSTKSLLGCYKLGSMACCHPSAYRELRLPSVGGNGGGRGWGRRNMVGPFRVSLSALGSATRSCP